MRKAKKITGRSRLKNIGMDLKKLTIVFCVLLRNITQSISLIKILRVVKFKREALYKRGNEIQRFNGEAYDLTVKSFLISQPLKGGFFYLAALKKP